MSLFGTSNTFSARPGGLFGSTTTAPQMNTSSAPVVNDIEVPSPPDDAIQAIRFNPAVAGMPILLAAGSWDCTIRIWQVNESGTVEPKAMQNVGAPILSIDWTDDGSKIFIAGADKRAQVWDLASNQLAVVGQHDEPISTCHWITSPNYNCLMTGGWDKTLRFWDMRQLPQQNSLGTIQLPDKVFCADMVFPMGAVALANRQVKLFKLDNSPQEVKTDESPLKYQSRCISIFRNKQNNQPNGYALGSIEGRVAIQYVEPSTPKDNFTFKCHRSPELINNFQEIYPVNDVTFHPQHYTLATIGSDGRYSFWDKDARTKLKTSDAFPLPLTKCHIHGSGNIFAYAVGYDWSRGHEGNLPGGANKIFLHACAEDMKPRPKNT